MVPLVFLLVTLAVVSANIHCKCTSQNPCWPSPYNWRAFNDSIGGNLLFPMPPAYKCHTPFNDAAACDAIAKVYDDRYWRIEHPVAMQQPQTELGILDDKGCIGVNNNSSFCVRGNLPYYVANASTIEHVQETVKFASAHNLRLVIRNTGHDFHGRSTAQGALSLWLHHMKKIEISSDFVEEGGSHFGSSRQKAITIGPGVQVFEAMNAATEKNLEFVGGSCPSVGMAGYTQGGGHGLLSPFFGLAADNILQFKVVTAAGQLVIANHHQHQELFWALRGGGGGTYGVVVETSFKAFDATPIFATFFMFSASTDEAYQALVNRLVESIPSWSDAGWSGYFYIYKTRTLVWNALTRTPSSSNTITPFLTFVNSTEGLSYQTVVESVFPNFYPFWYTISRPHDNPIYGNLLLGSWLMPRENFVGRAKVEQHTQTIFEVLRRNEGGYIFMMLVAGGAVSYDRSDTAANPAWRHALTHSVITANLADTASQQERQTLEFSITNTTQLFRDIAPESGAYTNEADANEPNWQRAFYGNNFARLSLTKKLYDPFDLFICHKCVGSEDWNEDLTCKVR